MPIHRFRQQIICFERDENVLSVLDFTNPINPRELGRFALHLTGYSITMKVITPTLAALAIFGFLMYPTLTDQ